MRIAIGLLGAVTLLAYLDRLSWFFELGSFLRVQYAVLLLLLALVVAARRQAVNAAAAVALAALNLATVAPHWISRAEAKPLGHDRVQLLFVNVDVSNHEHRATIDYLRALRPDVIGVTEFSPQWRDALRPVTRLYRYRVEAVRPDAYGIALFSLRPVDAQIKRFPAEGPPSVVARLTIAGHPVTVVVTHPHTPFGPHAGGLHQRQLRSLAAARPGWSPRALLCGDLNTPPWSGPLRSLMRRARLTDSHRGHGFESSWPTWGWPLRTPIDNCLVSPGLVVVDRSRGPKLGSDHFPLRIVVAATPLARAA